MGGHIVLLLLSFVVALFTCLILKAFLTIHRPTIVCVYLIVTRSRMLLYRIPPDAGEETVRNSWFVPCEYQRGHEHADATANRIWSKIIANLTRKGVESPVFRKPLFCNAETFVRSVKEVEDAFARMRRSSKLGESEALTYATQVKVYSTSIGIEHGYPLTCLEKIEEPTLKWLTIEEIEKLVGTDEVCPLLSPILLHAFTNGAEVTKSESAAAKRVSELVWTQWKTRHASDESTSNNSIGLTMEGKASENVG